MTPERLRELEALLSELTQIADPEREGRLAGIADPELRAELCAMLESSGPSATVADAIGGVAYGATSLNGTPTQFGPWRITGILGFGGMGAVYRAVRADLAYQKEVAVKVLHTGLAVPAVQERFRQERQILANLEHPNIARMLDGGETPDGHSYIVMEYVAGEDILSYCRRHQLSNEEKLRLFLPLCAAVQEAHGHHIIHRDLKPSNILVTGSGSPKLLDFGIAKWLEGTAPPTLTGLQPMTPQYASPEQMRGSELTPATDIYSLGAVLYEVLTGERAHHSGTDARLAPEVRSPEQIVPGFDKSLSAVLLKALESEPGRRYASAEEFAADLTRFLEHQPVQARPATPLTRTARQIRRRLPSIAAATLIMVVAAISVISGVFRSPAPPAPGKPLTALNGNQKHPSFSPDASQVVFSWEGEALDNRDLYITGRTGGPLRRITADPKIDDYPVWSPDGRRIAFVRDNRQVMVISLADNSERHIGDTDGRFVSWTPDSKAVLFAKSSAARQTYTLYQVAIESGDERRLTLPEENLDIFEPAGISPDGKYLAYSRRAGPSAPPELYVRPLAGGTANQLTHDRASILGWSWMPDSREIVFASKRLGPFHTIWRIATSGWSRKPVAIPETAHAAYPAVAGGVIAYERWSQHGGLVEVQLQTGKAGAVLETRTARSIVPSTGVDSSPTLSPDGAALAFISDRNGFDEIWRNDANGTNPTALTSFGPAGSVPGSPQWSPDGKQIVFDVREREHSNIYIMSGHGGPPRRVTAWPSSDQYRPRWSADGQWIYFGSSLNGRALWKVSAAAVDARPEQAIEIARGAFEGGEASDGSIYYLLSLPGWRGEIRAHRAGGPDAALNGVVTTHGWWVISGKGIYFLNRAAPKSESTMEQRSTLSFFDFGTQRVSAAGELDGELNLNTPDLCVSPDGRRLLYGRMAFANTNLMLIDRVR